jgi:hypothetical protein
VTGLVFVHHASPTRVVFAPGSSSALGMRPAGSISNGYSSSGRIPALALFRLARTLGTPSALRDLCVPRDALDRATDLASQNACANPRPIERTQMRGAGLVWRFTRGLGFQQRCTLVAIIVCTSSTKRLLPYCFGAAG